MNFAVITLFPEVFESARVGLTQTAQDKGIYNLEILNLREFGKGVHKAIDDEPYGGGDGMLMQCEPLSLALQKIKSDSQKFKKAKVINLSPKGKVWTQKMAEEWVKKSESLIFICGRYAGVDQRFIDQCCDEEISIGDYVLNGGELGALVMMDSMIRLLQGTLENPESISEDSFSQNNRLLEHPQYTRPQVWNDLSVPKTLLSGDHQKIEAWKKNMSLLETALKRWDLLGAKDVNALKVLLSSEKEIDQDALKTFGSKNSETLKSILNKNSIGKANEK